MGHENTKTRRRTLASSWLRVFVVAFVLLLEREQGRADLTSLRQGYGGPPKR
jgi:hypothetical protein